MFNKYFLLIKDITSIKTFENFMVFYIFSVVFFAIIVCLNIINSDYKKNEDGFWLSAEQQKEKVFSKEENKIIIEEITLLKEIKEKEYRLVNLRSRKIDVLKEIMELKNEK